MPRAGTAAFLPPAQFVHAPEALGRAWSQPDARAYTRWLATRHYENFHVVSFLLPKRLHQDFYNVYAYCRWADDLGDEIGDREESLRLLAWWSGELDGMYQGRATHPVFVALEETVRRHQIPRRPFADLILAFVQDQNVTRYAGWDELFDYCRCSANPRRKGIDPGARHVVDAARELQIRGLDAIDPVEHQAGVAPARAVGEEPGLTQDDALFGEAPR